MRVRRKGKNMEEERIEKIYEILNNIPVTVDNFDTIQKIRESLLNQDYIGALKKLEILSKEQKNDNKVEESYKQEEEETGSIYPNKLSNIPLERTYMGILLSDPKLIVKYYFLFEDCYFEDESILNIYKSVLFTEGGAYTPEIAKQGFNFSRDSEQVYKLKNQLKAEVANKTYNMEKIYLDLKKLFVLRKNYLAIPIKSIQDKVVEITDYILYDKMSVEEVKSKKHFYDYVFMSPVYDCISKEGILSGYTPEELRAAGKERIIDTKVMALGGITPDNILEIKDFGFGGAVVLGDLWNKFNVCTDRDYLGVIRHFKKLKEMAD